MCIPMRQTRLHCALALHYSHSLTVMGMYVNDQHASESWHQVILETTNAGERYVRIFQVVQLLCPEDINISLPKLSFFS